MYLLSEELLNIAEFFSILSESTRLKIIMSLREGEKSVSELVEEVGMSQSAISHQLRILRQGRVVKYRKDGKRVLYSLDDEHVTKIIDQAIEHEKHR